MNSIKGRNGQEKLSEQQQQLKRNQDQMKTNGVNLGNQTSVTKHNEQSNSICTDNNNYDNDARIGVSNVTIETKTTKSRNNNKDENSGDNNKRLVDSDKQTLNQFGLCTSKYHCHDN